MIFNIVLRGELEIAFSEFVILIYLTIALSTFYILVVLGRKYFAHHDQNYRINHLTQVLLLLVFFIFFDSVYFVYSYFSGLFMPSAVPNHAIQLTIKIGIFVSIVFMAYYIFSKKIEELRDQEVSLSQLVGLNKELEHKAKEMELSQMQQQQKLKELEKFNDIAKQREGKMIDLIKKIEKLESELKRKSK